MLIPAGDKEWPVGGGVFSKLPLFGAQELLEFLGPGAQRHGTHLLGTQLSAHYRFLHWELSTLSSCSIHPWRAWHLDLVVTQINIAASVVLQRACLMSAMCCA